MPLQQWVRLPTAWIQSHGLRAFRWAGAERSDNTAALMLLLPIAHHADNQTGIAHMTYNKLGEATGPSRAKVSGGLSVLETHGLIARDIERRSTYQLCNYDPERGWGKIPARGLYASDDDIVAFRHFHLRRPAELDALKLYYLFAAFRDNATNQTYISYDKITEYTGIERGNIKRGQSLLVTHDLIQVEYAPSSASDHGMKNSYRLMGLEPNKHMGTTGRTLISSVNFADELGLLDVDLMKASE